MRTRVQNTLQAMALGHGLRRGKTLWGQSGQHTLASLPLPPYAAHRRRELLALYGQLQGQIEELDKRVMDHAQQRSGAKLLMTHPGVGPVTALAAEVFLGDPARFENSKALVSYVGATPDR
jgi:transposase